MRSFCLTGAGQIAPCLCNSNPVYVTAPAPLFIIYLLRFLPVKLYPFVSRVFILQRFCLEIVDSFVSYFNCNVFSCACGS